MFCVPLMYTCSVPGIFIEHLVNIPEAQMFVQSLIKILSDEKFLECFHFMTVNIS